jgi:membrane protein required for colicin V production
MNLFDAAVYLCLAVAVVMGFRTGLLRSVATIAGYLAAAPVAVMAAPHVAPLVNAQLKSSSMQTWLILFGVFVVIGLALSALLRLSVSTIAGEHISAPDRAAGALLGAIRIVLLAVLMVLVFDRLIPAGREPEFLKGSQLRPILSAAGQQGLRSLPPDVTETIDRLKRERGL